MANKKCTIDKSTAWVSMSALMNGTKLFNYVQDKCTDDDMQAFNNILTLVDKCLADDRVKSIAYMGGKYTSLALNQAFEEAQEVYRVHGTTAICSNQNSGTNSMSKARYQYLGSKIEHGTDDQDDIVTFQSCRGGLSASRFTISPSNRFDASECNHEDTAFHNGNSYTNDAHKPVQWFERLIYGTCR